jgi:predicted secreted protein
MPLAVFGKGTRLQRKVAGVWETIAQVKSIEGPGITKDVLDVTTMDTVANWREKLTGLADAGELTFAVNFIPSHPTHSATSGFMKDLVDGTQRDHQIIFPDVASTTWLFPNSQIRSAPISVPVDNVLEANVTILITEPPVLS